jgi:hypothetical protein
MKRAILELLGRNFAVGSRLGPGPARAGLLTTREVAIVLAAGAGEAVRATNDVDIIRSAVADLALAWRAVDAPAPPVPVVVRVLDGVAHGLVVVADEDKVREALRWLAGCDEFWSFVDAERAGAHRRSKR